MAKQVKRALLVGINRYEDPRNNLRGCVNDALMVGKLLTENYAFQPEDVRLLIDDRATTEGIRERLKWLVDDAAPGSVLVFHFSGHGSQVRDRNGDELEDGLDEILCPYDLDWDDPFTDDELRKAIESTPKGVNFTLLLDCCHSGTGTRMFFKEAPVSGRTPSQRYLVPPPDVSFRMAGGVELDLATPERTVNMRGRRNDLKVRRFGSTLVDQNAVLIAGCRSDQTSADAWIDNDYHGALTYSLYWTLQQHRFSIAYRSLISEAGGWLETQRYGQIPQLEGPDEMLAWSFLSTAEHRAGALVTSLVGAPAPETMFKAAAETQVVFVHGIGDHKPGYSDRWRAAFNRYLGLPLANFHEVVWDDVFDGTLRGERGLRAPPALGAAEERMRIELEEELRDVLLARADALTTSQIESPMASRDVCTARDLATERGILDWIVNFDEYIGDFAKYLASSKVRDSVDAKLEAVLKPLLSSGQPVTLITHSWGTVVGHHTLRRLRKGPQVALHVTLGSPLWIRAIRRQLDFDGNVFACSRWINVDADADLIGGRLNPPYKIHSDLKVPCVGSDAHGSYFHPDNTLVQRDIIAKAIREVSQDRAVDLARSITESVRELVPHRAGQTAGRANGKGSVRRPRATSRTAASARTKGSVKRG